MSGHQLAESAVQRTPVLDQCTLASRLPASSNIIESCNIVATEPAVAQPCCTPDPDAGDRSASCCAGFGGRRATAVLGDL